MFNLPYFGSWDVDAFLRTIPVPSAIEKPQAAHPFSLGHDGGHGMSGPRGGKKRGKKAREAERKARRKQRS